MAPLPNPLPASRGYAGRGGGILGLPAGRPLNAYAVEGWVAVTVAGDGSRDLLTSAGPNGRQMQRRDARQAFEVGRVQGENIGVEQVRGHR